MRDIGFIVGMGRSGTTLIAAILNRHPKICVLPETGFFIHINNLPQGAATLAQDWPESMNLLGQKMMRNATSTWNPLETAQLLIKKFPCFPGIRTLFQEFCTIIARKHDKPEARLILEKTPDHMLCVEDIKLQFPEAFILHIIRDGRAVAESRSRMSFLPPSKRSLEFNIFNWAWRMEKIRPIILNQPRSIEFRYEELVNHPEKTLQRILTFLQVDYSPEILQPTGNEDHLIETGMSHKDGVKQPITQELITKWQKIIPAEQQKVLEQLAGKQLYELGYPLYHIEPNKLKPALIPHTFLDHPILLEKYIDVITKLIQKHGNIISGSYSGVENAPYTHDLYVSDFIETKKAKQIGSLQYLMRILKLAFQLKLRKKKILFLQPKPQFTFRQWPLAHSVETLLRVLYAD